MLCQKKFVLNSIFILLILAGAVEAQTVTNADLEASEREKKLAENRKAIAEAKKAELDARFPKPDASSVVGGTSVEGEFIESRMLGYCAMKSAASLITKNIKTRISNGQLPANPKFIVYNEPDVKMLMRYQLMIQRLEILRNGYVGLPGVIAPAAGAAARGFGPGLIADTVLDYLSLLKTDIAMSGTEFDLNEKELVAEIFSNLPGLELYYPARMPLSLKNSASSSKLFQEIVVVGDVYIQARSLVVGVGGFSAADAAQRERLDILYLSTMKELGLGKAPDPVPAVAPAPAPPPPPPATAVQTTNVNVNTAEKDDEGGSGGSSDRTFISYLQADNLYTEINRPNSYWIDLQVVKAGGNMRIKSNFITNFLFSSRVNFSGGSIVYFHVFDAQGKSRLSGVYPVYEKYRSSNQITSACN